MKLDFTRLDVLDAILERITESHAVLRGTGAYIDDTTAKKLTKAIEKEGKRHIKRLWKMARDVRKETNAEEKALKNKALEGAETPENNAEKVEDVEEETCNEVAQVEVDVENNADSEAIEPEEEEATT
ncbi:MAG: hypothetical protein E7382_05460 [Clostridiales bacterium]|nr:hypothetical protein [Clostridiales bacterium]